MTDNEIIPVRINGKEYATKLYDGVQRFVPDTAVEKLVSLCIDNFHGPASGRQPVNFYDQIPASLLSLDHENPVVNYMVEMNKEGHFGLNELAVALHYERVTLADYIDFCTLHNGSLGWFMDSVESTISNLGLVDEAYDEEDDEYYTDYTPFLLVENPLWAD